MEEPTLPDTRQHSSLFCHLSKDCAQQDSLLIFLHLRGTTVICEGPCSDKLSGKVPQLIFSHLDLETYKVFICMQGRELKSPYSEMMLSRCSSWMSDMLLGIFSGFHSLHWKGSGDPQILCHTHRGTDISHTRPVEDLQPSGSGS